MIRCGARPVTVALAAVMVMKQGLHNYSLSTHGVQTDSTFVTLGQHSRLAETVLGVLLDCVSFLRLVLSSYAHIRSISK